MVEFAKRSMAADRPWSLHRIALVAKRISPWPGARLVSWRGALAIAAAHFPKSS
jgi:hypothetical protein